MKKIITILLAAAIATTLISCSSKDKTGADSGNNNEVKEDVAVVYENVDLTAVADSLYDGIPEENMPMVMSMPLTEDDFEFFTFMPYEDGLEAVVSEPMIGSIAHSVVLVKCPDETTAKRLASSMKENANPRKWVCVEADIVEGVTNGNLAMLLMTTTEGGLSETILNNFKALDADKIAALKSEAVEEMGKSEEAENEEMNEEAVDNEEELPQEDNVVIELPETKVDDAPAAMPEKENTPAVMPEVTPEVETPVVEPEVEMPVVTPEVETAPAEPEDVPVTAPEVEEPKAEVTIDTLYTIADGLYNGIPEEMPMVMTMELASDNFEYSAFVPYKSSYLAVESAPMISTLPHSVVIVKTDSPEEAAKVASDMKANADPRKWICSTARAVKSASKGNFAILVMTSVDVMPDETIDEAAAEEMSNKQSEERANIIINNFLAAVK